MIQLTKAQIKILKKYESYLQTAYKSDYIRCLCQKDAIELASVYQELGFQHPNLSCGNCKLNMCRNLGKIYFNQDEK